MTHTIQYNILRTYLFKDIIKSEKFTKIMYFFNIQYRYRERLGLRIFFSINTRKNE